MYAGAAAIIKSFLGCVVLRGRGEDGWSSLSGLDWCGWDFCIHFVPVPRTNDVLSHTDNVFFFRCYWLPSLYSFAQRERSLTNQWVVKRLFKANEFVENTINRQWTESDRMCAWFWGCSWYECDGVLTRERSIQNRRLFSSALDGFGHHQEVIRFWTNASNGSVRIRTFDIPHLLRILNVPRLWMISFPS